MSGRHIESDLAAGAGIIQYITQAARTAVIAITDYKHLGFRTSDADANRQKVGRKVILFRPYAGQHSEKEKRLRTVEIRIRGEFQPCLALGRRNDPTTWNLCNTIVLKQPAVGDAEKFEVSHFRAVDRITSDYQ